MKDRASNDLGPYFSPKPSPAQPVKPQALPRPPQLFRGVQQSSLQSSWV